MEARLICEPGPRATEARLLAELRRAAEASRREPELLALPLRVLVPSDALRLHLSARIVEEFGGAAGLVVQTLRSAARECTARRPDPPRPAELGVPMWVRRLARQESALQEALEALEDGYGAVTAAVDDLLDAGLDASVAEAVLDGVADLPPGPQRDRAAAVVRVALATGDALALHGGVHRSQLFRAAREAVESDPAVLPVRALWVHGLADATGVLLDFVETLVREREARVLLDLPVDPAERTKPAPGISFTDRLTGRLGAFGREDADLSGAAGVDTSWCRTAGAQGEVRHAARRIREILDASDLAPERIAVVLRDPAPYRTALSTELGRFAVPFSGVDGFMGAAGRRVQALLGLVERGNACPADVWLDAHAPAPNAGDLRLGLHGIGVGRVGQLAELDVDLLLGDRDAYLLPVRRMLTSDAKDDPGDSGDLGDLGDRGNLSVRRRLWRSTLVGAIESARRIAVRLHEPSERAPVEAHIRALRELVNRDLGWTPDTQGAEIFRRAISKLEEELPGHVPIDRSELTLLLRRAIGNAGVLALGGEGAGVQVRSVTDARACTFEHVFVLGLNREVFPRTISEDAILPDPIRERIAVVLNDLPIKQRGHDEDRYLFAHLLSAAPHVHGSWQAVSDDGKERSRSPLVERLRLLAGVEIETAPGLLEEAVDGVPRPPLERAVRAGLVGHRRLAEEALAAALGGTDGAAVAAHRHAALREMEGVGDRRQRLGPFLGLVGPAAPADPRSDSMYVTRLEGLHYCAWQTFLQRVLRVEPLPDALAALPELSALVVGNVMHEALELIVRESGAESGDIGEVRGREPVRAHWPSDQRVDELVEAAASKVARDEGVLLEGFARFLAEVARPHVERVRELDWAEGPPAVLGVEMVGEAQLPGVDRTIFFRADRVDSDSGSASDGLDFVDYKGGKPISSAKKPDTRRDHLEKQVANGRRLQAGAYAVAAGPGGSGRYLFSSPGLPDEQANVAIEASDAELLGKLGIAVGKGLAVWDEGFFVPRLVDTKGEKGSSCQWCDLSEACVQGDSSMRRRLRERIEAVAEADSAELATERGLYSLWRDA